MKKLLQIQTGFLFLLAVVPIPFLGAWLFNEGPDWLRFDCIQDVYVRGKVVPLAYESGAAIVFGCILLAIFLFGWGVALLVHGCEPEKKGSN